MRTDDCRGNHVTHGWSGTYGPRVCIYVRHVGLGIEMSAYQYPRLALMVTLLPAWLGAGSRPLQV